MKKNLYVGNKNASKPDELKQSEQILFRVTPSEKKKLGKYPNKKAKKIVLADING